MISKTTRTIKGWFLRNVAVKVLNEAYDQKVTFIGAIFNSDLGVPFMFMDCAVQPYFSQIKLVRLMFVNEDEVFDILPSKLIDPRLQIMEQKTK